MANTITIKDIVYNKDEMTKDQITIQEMITEYINEADKHNARAKALIEILKESLDKTQQGTPINQEVPSVDDDIIFQTMRV